MITQAIKKRAEKYLCEEYDRIQAEKNYIGMLDVRLHQIAENVKVNNDLSDQALFRDKETKTDAPVFIAPVANDEPFDEAIHEALIKAKAERDIYKELYEYLLNLIAK